MRTIIFIILIQSACLMAADFPLLYEEKFEDEKLENWHPVPADGWQVIIKEDQPVLYLSEPGKLGTPRRPGSYAILMPFDVGSFELIVNAKCQTDPSNKYRDLCLFFGFQDSVHFYYTHFSGTSDKVHNIIGLVNNADRVKINDEPAGGSVPRMKDSDWHTLKIVRDVDAATIKAYIDDMEKPVLTAGDSTFQHGKVGVGSFDDTGWFKDIKLYGEIVQTGLNGEEHHRPGHFKLGQNYPNPFNARTKIPYTVTEKSDIRLSIFDVLGKEMSSFAFAGQPPGQYVIGLNAEDYLSGVYFYKAQCGYDTQLKKMLLIR